MSRDELTREAVEAMPAGDEMDALVAELVMGWKDAKVEFVRGVGCPGQDVLLGTSPDGRPRQPVPGYSRDMGAAWEVVRGLLEGTAARLLALTLDHAGPGAGDRWRFSAVTRLGHASAGYTDDFAATAPLAICRAALLAAAKQGVRP